MIPSGTNLSSNSRSACIMLSMAFAWIAPVEIAAKIQEQYQSHTSVTSSKHKIVQYAATATSFSTSEMEYFMVLHLQNWLWLISFQHLRQVFDIFFPPCAWLSNCSSWSVWGAGWMSRCLNPTSPAVSPVLSWLLLRSFSVLLLALLIHSQVALSC